VEVEDQIGGSAVGRVGVLELADATRKFLAELAAEDANQG
jgi:hypothetical protein